MFFPLTISFAEAQNEPATLVPLDGDANARLVDRGVGTPETEDKTVFDRIWDLSKIYRNDDAPFLQEISLLGR